MEIKKGDILIPKIGDSPILSKKKVIEVKDKDYIIVEEYLKDTLKLSGDRLILDEVYINQYYHINNNSNTVRRLE